MVVEVEVVVQQMPMVYDSYSISLETRVEMRPTVRVDSMELPSCFDL